MGTIKKQQPKERPVLPGLDPSQSSSFEEQFQNAVLRPILKMQHPLIIKAFLHYLEKRKINTANLSKDERANCVLNALRKDTAFRNYMIGMVIGQCTSDEYHLYTSVSNALNKRVLQLLQQRLLDSVSEWT